MVSPRTSNFILIQSYTYECGKYDTKTLPAGTFVRPIDLSYIPEHILEDKRWIPHNNLKDVFCYTKYGILPIPRIYISET